jgi:adenylosuccinate lyase
MTTDALRAVLDPATYTGHASRIVDRVLADARSSGWLD